MKQIAVKKEASGKASLAWPGMTFRSEVRLGDDDQVRRICHSTGVFSPEEVELAQELVRERLRIGLASGYYFLLAEINGRLVGYSCFGPIPCTSASFDLYWMAVDKEWRHLGLGREILTRTEIEILALGGRCIFIETSSRLDYRPARAFYRRLGYQAEALLKDFYAPGDHKLILAKVISPANPSASG